MKKYLYALLCLLVIAAVTLYFLPYNNIAASKIKQALGARGIKVNSLSVLHVGKAQTNITNLKLGNEPPLNIEQIDAKYFHKDAIKGKLKTVDVKGMELNIYNKNGNWQVGGLEALSKPSSAAPTQPAISFDKLHGLLPEQINITDSKFLVADDNLQISAPFDFALTNAPDKIFGQFNALGVESSGSPYNFPVLDVKVDYELTAKELLANIHAQDAQKKLIIDANFYKNATKSKFKTVDIKGLELNVYNKDGKWQIAGLEAFNKPSDAAPTPPAINFDKLHGLLPEQIKITDAKFLMADDKLQISAPFDFALTNATDKISGKLSATRVTSSGLPYDLPALDVQVSYELAATKLLANINAIDAKKQYILDAKLVAPIADIMAGSLVINKISFPYGGGVVAANGIKIPLKMDKPINITLNLKDIDLAGLLDEISGGEIKGTGKITGKVPITYYPDGHITVQKGAAQAADAGTLIVSPTLLPGENAQLTIARDTLQNFHYTALKIAVSSSDDGKSVIAFSLDGSNPDANNGRQVKLYVNVSGDIIPIIQQSLLAINDLKQLLHIEEVK